MIRVHLSLGGIAKKELSLILATFFYLGFYRITLLLGCLLHLISAPHPDFSLPVSFLSGFLLLFGWFHLLFGMRDDRAEGPLTSFGSLRN